MNLEFDLKDGTVKAETAARDARGLPYYQYLFNLKDDAQVSIEAPTAYDQFAIENYYVASRIEEAKFWSEYNA